MLFKRLEIEKKIIYQLILYKKVIGRIILNTYLDGYIIQSSLIKENERGKGYGKIIYLYAINELTKEGHSVYRGNTISKGSISIWNHLEEIGLTDKNQKVIYGKSNEIFK